jgi:phenylalanyl-tRNA synthetase alpha subunit
MVHPNVLTSCGIDPRSGRASPSASASTASAPSAHGVDDLRDLFTNDIRF